MKKKRHSFIHIRLRQASNVRKIRRAKRIRRHLNMRVKKKDARSREPRYRSYTPMPYEAIAPVHFCLSNLDGILKFIYQTENACRKKQKINFLKINLDNVVEIDSFAISFLLSFLNRLSSQHIRYWGTYPNDKSAQQFIIDSGFLEIVKTNIKRPSNNRTGNQIFMVGKDSVDSHLIGQAVRDSMVHVIGRKDCYPPVYDDLLEISANSVEHANQVRSDKNWLISISTDEDKVHFIATDTGAGILSTLRKKATEQLFDTFAKGDAEVLHDVFMKLYQSITGEVNRHKGLPIILESFTDGFISDFMVITNKVLYNFGNNTHQILRKGFDGVLYSWTISKDNYNNWLKSL